MNNDTRLYSNITLLSNNDNQTYSNLHETSLAEFCQNSQLIVFLCIIFVLIVSANISVILQLSCSKKRHSRMSFFLLNLAYADLLVGSIIVTRDIIEKSCIPFRLGSIGCRLISFIQVTIAYNSSYVLVCVSIDRLYAIVRPMDVRTASSTFRYALIIASWIISMSFASAQLYLRDIETFDGMPVCGNRSDVKNWNAYVYFLFLSLYLVPLIVMTVSYVVIIVIIWRKSSVADDKNASTISRTEKSKIRRLLSPKLSNAHDERSIESSIRNVRSLGVIPRAKIKTVKMTLVIVIAFTACWSPYFLLSIMNSFNLINSYSVRVTSSLCYMNSLANPLIYWLFVTDFCLRFRRKLNNTNTTRTTLATNDGHSSLSESTYTVGSTKNPRRRSSEYHRAHHPRTPSTTSVTAARLSNYRTSTLVYAQASKRIVQHQNSQASLLHNYPHQR